MKCFNIDDAYIIFKYLKIIHNFAIITPVTSKYQSLFTQIDLMSLNTVPTTNAMNQGITDVDFSWQNHTILLYDLIVC